MTLPQHAYGTRVSISDTIFPPQMVQNLDKSQIYFQNQLPQLSPLRGSNRRFANNQRNMSIDSGTVPGYQ